MDEKELLDSQLSPEESQLEQELNLDDLLNEFLNSPEDDLQEQADNQDSLAEILEDFSQPASAVAEPLPERTIPAPAQEEAPAAPAEEEAPAPEAAEASLEETRRIDAISQIPDEAVTPPEQAAPAEEPAPIAFSKRTRIQELKKKLIAGPEKRYYDLSELGLGKLQVGILLNLIICALCIAGTTMFTLGLIPENRLRFVIFTQFLAMLISAFLGSHLMLDSLGAVFKGKFTLDTLVPLTFIACTVDAVFCFQELRVPCCAAFSLEMTLAMLARLHRRSTEMNQMDTLRKAVKLISLVRCPDYQGKSGAILRGDGDVSDFMDTYNKPSTPEKVQSIYAFFALIACFGIAAVAGMRHTPSFAFQVLALSLLAAAPAGFFVAHSRPAALLERRLHMAGSVLCGWQGVRKLSAKAMFPLTDIDLFPKESTKLNGVKFYGKHDPGLVVSYAASLVGAAGGGLVTVVHKLLASRGGKELPVENFQDYGSGGIGGEIGSDTVLLGTLNFLQDCGVDIPSGTMVNQAIYVAINGELSAVIAISYAKMRSATAGLVSLCGCRKLTPVVLSRDFMVTGDFIRSKFGINPKRIRFPEIEERNELLARTADPQADVLALATRDDLTAAVYPVAGARQLRRACILGNIIGILGGLMGMLAMLALAWLGSAELLTPTHVFLYQAVWLIPGWLATEWTRTV